MVKIICIIPARSGSKGIKNKNLKKINHLTLIEHSIVFAKKTGIFDKIVLSTDSQKYLYYASKHGLNTPYLRNKILSKNFVKDIEFLKPEFIKYEKYFGKKFDYACLMQPTSIPRYKKDFFLMLKKIIRFKPGALWTVKEVDYKFNPIKQLVIKNNQLEYYDKKGSNFVARQLLKKTFVRNGNAYFLSRNNILKNNWLPRASLPFIQIKQKIFNIDDFKDYNNAKMFIEGKKL